MYRIFVIHVLACWGLLLPQVAWAQYQLDRELVATGGNDVTVGEWNISYSIGELAAVATVSSDDAMWVFTQGFQQHDDILLSVEEDLRSILSFQVAPNPVKTSARVEVQTDKLLDLDIGFFNFLGQELPVPVQKNLVGNFWKAEFDLSRLPEGHYLLALKNSQGAVLKTYTLQKIN